MTTVLKGLAPLAMLRLGIAGHVESDQDSLITSEEKLKESLAGCAEERYRNSKVLACPPPAVGGPGASGAAVVGAALCGPSVPAPRSAEAHSPRGWRDS